MSVFAFSSELLFSLMVGGLNCWSLCCISSVTLVMVHMVDSLFAVGSGESVSSSIRAPVSSTDKNQLFVIVVIVCIVLQNFKNMNIKGVLSLTYVSNTLHKVFRFTEFFDHGILETVYCFWH